MRRVISIGLAIFMSVIMISCSETTPFATTTLQSSNPSPTISNSLYNVDPPRIASWLAKKEEIIASGKPYDLVMSGWFTPEEALSLRSNNPRTILLAGLSINWVYGETGWLNFLITVASYGRNTTFSIKDEMYLKDGNGNKCIFGWASAAWGQNEIYAMDPRNPEWVEIITCFYRNVLKQSQHDGIIVDMVTEKSWCPESISDQEWISATRSIMEKIRQLNTENKLVVFNSGRDFSEIDSYAEYMDGFLMENFMGNGFGATFDEGLRMANTGKLVIYAVDTDDTGQQAPDRMRLGLVLSMLNDNAFFTYDFGPRDHGQAWWFPEYDVDLGQPLGPYYQKGNAYFRDFEKGVVIASPLAETTVTFDQDYTDATSGISSSSFRISAGDGRIYLK